MAQSRDYGRNPSPRIDTSGGSGVGAWASVTEADFTTDFGSPGGTGMTAVSFSESSGTFTVAATTDTSRRDGLNEGRWVDADLSQWFPDGKTISADWGDYACEIEVYEISNATSNTTGMLMVGIGETAGDIWYGGAILDSHATAGNVDLDIVSNTGQPDSASLGLYDSYSVFVYPHIENWHDGNATAGVGVVYVVGKVGSAYNAGLAFTPGLAWGSTGLKLRIGVGQDGTTASNAFSASCKIRIRWISIRDGNET